MDVTWEEMYDNNPNSIIEKEMMSRITDFKQLCRDTTIDNSCTVILNSPNYQILTEKYKMCSNKIQTREIPSCLHSKLMSRENLVK